MRSMLIKIHLFLFALVAFGQSDRGTITGAVADPGGAVVAGAAIEAQNVETGGLYNVASTTTGNYTLSQLPTGTYTLSVSVAGFKKYVRQNVVVGVAQTIRIDIVLEIGASSESVTVTEEATLLKTESGELSHNVAAQTMDSLPILGLGASAGSSGFRNPAAVTQLLPGSYYVGNSSVIINGAQGNTNQYRIEGMDASNGYLSGLNQMTQPSVDAIQEISVQTSNYAAEYGQVGGGYFNLTMKSGTNQYHGSAYDYFANEALNAGQAFTDNGNGGLLRPVVRQNDYGFTLGGPVWIPKIYNGHDKTFFFFNFEQFRQSQTINTMALTIPIADYRTGNFGQALTGRTLATDPLGRPILENSIYDPTTQRAAPNGQLVRDVFANNLIPTTRIDPVAAKIQGLIPQPTISGILVNNGIYPWVSDRISTIPAFKIDQAVTSKGKFSFYFSETKTQGTLPPGNAGSDGLPLTITAAKNNTVNSYTERLNYDYTLTPTLLLHFGAGYTDNDFYNTAPVLNNNASASLGLNGAPVAVGQFPTFTGLSAARGGMVQMGPGAQSNPYMGKPTATASVTWVKNNHTFKAGAEMRLESYIGRLYTNTTGAYSFNVSETGLPSTQGQNLSGGTVGFPYASFLLGLVDTVAATDPAIFRLGKHELGAFAQDSWKVTRKLTLDYGLRYDFSSYLKEEYGRMLNFSAVTPNPSAGGLLGATIFEGNGPGRCGCQFAKNYPWGFAPRVGAAYQISPKTVFRAGFGIVYANTADANGAANTLPISAPIGSPGFGAAVMTLQGGIPQRDFSWPNFNPGQYPQGSSLTAPPIAIDQNAGRPPRQVQWSAGLQREIQRDLVMEVSYVANVGVWWNSPGLIDVNALTPQLVAAHGLNINNAADLTLLSSPLNSTIAAQRGFGTTLPYAGYPTTATVAQSLRPFPQFGTITSWWSPLGKTWYDSLQAKATKRFSHGLSFTSVFTWQKSLVLGAANAVTAGTGGTSPNDVLTGPSSRRSRRTISPSCLTPQPRILCPGCMSTKSCRRQ